MENEQKQLTLDDVFRAPTVVVERVEVVEATEEEIQAAIIFLKLRSWNFEQTPLQVKAHPFRPALGWRQAALDFIRKNRIEAEKGRPIVL